MPVPWVWLYGPPGVGKSATGFELFDQLVKCGKRVAFIEIDQIGMCMPASLAERSAAKADNLIGILDNFNAVGADGVIVSGDIVETMSEPIARATQRPVLCRLRADDDVTIERLTIRDSLHYAMSSQTYESYDLPAADLDVTTHPMEVSEVAAQIVRRLGPWAPAATQTRSTGAITLPVIDDCSAVLITGPRAVGTSTVAWQVLMASIESGHRTGYLDLEQLGFLSPALDHSALATKLANVASCWAGFRSQDAGRLVLCGHIQGHDLSVIRKLMPSIRVVALTAAPNALLARAERRRQHKDIWLPGDDLFGCDDEHLRRVTRDADAFEPEGADVVLETDRLTPAETAARMESHWPAAMAARQAERRLDSA